jgi:hypothetical protein
VWSVCVPLGPSTDMFELVGWFFTTLDMIIRPWEDTPITI